MPQAKQTFLIDTEKLKKFFKEIRQGVKKGVPRIVFTIFTIIFIATEVIITLEMIPHVKTILSVKAAQIWPSAFDPVARFVANIDWKTNTVELDASMSKAFEDKIEKYIWRIDDGTSLVGEKTLKHQFANPGYYFIQLSVIDQHGQSDVATCQILLPPQEVEKIPTTERLESSRTTETSVEQTSYVWAPKGTFFNYSKLPPDKQSYADLKSRYVESGCGLSNQPYNISDVTTNVSLRNRSIRKAVASLVLGIIGMAILPIIYLLVKRRSKVS